VGSKEKALQNGTYVPAFSRVQSKAAEACCNTVEAANTSFSRTGVNNTSEASCSRTGIGNTAEAPCSRTDVSITDEAGCSGTCLSNTAEERCSRTDVSNSSEASCSRIGVSNSAEATCSRTGVSSTCDADILDTWKTDVLSEKTVEENSSAASQGVGMTENNISLSTLNPVVDIQRKSNNKIEQLNGDSDSDADFVEVTDIASLPVHSRTSEKNALELVIQKDKICEIEDDIFADIFSAQTSKGILATDNNLQDSTINSISSGDITHTGLRGIENGKFDKGSISGGNNDSKEGSESKLKDSKLAENIVTQVECRRKDLEVETDVTASCAIKPEQKDKKPQAAHVTTITLSSEELQKLQVQALCYCVCLFLSLFNEAFSTSEESTYL
jgi:hypothetical protein